LVIPAVLASTSAAGLALFVPLPSTGVVAVPELFPLTEPLATEPLEGDPLVVPLPTLVEPDGPPLATVPLAGGVMAPDAAEPEPLVLVVPLEGPLFCEASGLALPQAATTKSAPVHVNPATRRMSAAPKLMKNLL
jgi:hypothetical protein